MGNTPSEHDDLARALSLLGELRTEIASTAGLDTERRERVLGEIEEIRLRLRASAADHEPSARDTLEQLALDFETTHPTAAELVNRLTTLLAGMGI